MVDDRRQYQRLRAPVYCRPAGLSLRLFAQDRQQPQDISLGGMRIYADEPVKQGARLELELFLPDNSTVLCRVEVVWVEHVVGGTPARYDVGLKFTEIKAADRARLAEVLDE